MKSNTRTRSTIAIVDKDRNAVSFINSLFLGVWVRDSRAALRRSASQQREVKLFNQIGASERHGSLALSAGDAHLIIPGMLYRDGEAHHAVPA